MFPIDHLLGLVGISWTENHHCVGNGLVASVVTRSLLPLPRRQGSIGQTGTQNHFDMEQTAVFELEKETDRGKTDDQILCEKMRSFQIWNQVLV